MELEWLNVGKIVNTHGVRGEVRVVSKTDFPEERYKKGSVLYIFKQGQSEPLKVTVASHRQHKQFDLLTFEEINSLNEAEHLKESILKVEKENLGSLDEGEFYFHQIIGCEVYDEEDKLIGQIKEILTPGANDVWVIGRKGKKDALIPYIPSVVKNIDISSKTVHIEVMEGLIDE
ncbi:ribosome maturation factor RimM [Bacillus safensis]|uniref:ribosome maturation factor RimM n=1 Tax=Bacillus safensis TaxID=561879 RepID=UPI000BA57C0D|nr:ribosome maturation factor RimM [Bacillus safensis]MCY7674995.1 ribosome maturation factor RimM [Bacillus safensis]MCY7697908.1 ribosome maturation factor RimM [Bacillus safensis]MDI0272291.1 ribosome maturation factor RimM [Bacillus safensis]MEC3627294.1 ribosome maturation factor RimM [Bacillus safensis]OYN66814.1 ribosome maturation factor RimM [Bacillus safensis]